MTMKVELQINSSVSARARFVSWAPSPCRIRVTDPSGATSPTTNVQITGVSTAGGGAVGFRGGTTGLFSNSLTLPVPITGASVPFFMAGRFGRPSINDGDVRIEARNGTTLVGAVKLMVRIRKNANTLTPGERDRFVAAFAQLNNQGAGRFTDFRDMHTSVSSPQAHGAPGFLPWHRALRTPGSAPWKVIRTDQRTPALAVPSRASRQPRKIHSSFCFTATSIDCGRSGRNRMAASIRLRRPRTTAIPGTRSAITCL